MTNIQKFAAQQLSKKEMNNVKGGRIWCYASLDGQAVFGDVAVDTVADAERQLHATYDSLYDNVIVICDERV